MKRSQSHPLRYDYSKREWSNERRLISKKARHHRLSFLIFLMTLWGCLVTYRLYTLQISEVSHWRTSALKQHETTVELASERGAIVDRNGRMLAVSVPASSIYIRPKQIKQREAVVEKLSHILNVSTTDMEKKLDSSSPFVWVIRQVPRVKAKKIEKLDLDGVGQLLESRRYYPYSTAASVLIGKVGVDGNGLSGIEAIYDKQLHGDNTKVRISRDAFGQRIEPPQAARKQFLLPKGESLRITIDAAMQQIMDEELERGRQNANAKFGLAVMTDADTGDILAMSQAPTLNMNAKSIRSKNVLRNLVAETVFEPGSVLKPIVAAAAMQAGVINQNDILDCENGAYRFGRHLINDVHGSDELSLHDIVVRSSNIGMTKVGMRLGAQNLYESLKRFGFGRASGLGLPGETPGILRNVKSWAKIDVATHAYGQGIAVTPLQMVRAVSAIANGGYLPELRLVQDAGKPRSKQILSPQVAQAARDMMYGVVEDEHGTGKRAQVQGIRIGGKTGTAQRARENGRGYEPGSYVASFVGFVNGEDLGIQRKLVLYVVIDRPDTTSIYGGTLAGPVFQRIIQRTMYLLMTDQREQDTTRPYVPYQQQHLGKNELHTVAYTR